MPHCRNCDNAHQFMYECHTYELVTFDDLGRLETQQVLASTTLKIRCYQCNSEDVNGSQPVEEELERG